MSAEARDRLAERQAELVAALTGRAGPPSGFDAAAVERAARSLADKRRCGVARAWPGVREELVERFAGLFEEYGRACALPPDVVPLADARAFVRWLRQRERVSDRLEFEALAMDLWHAVAPALRARLLGHPRRLLVGLRLPWGRPRWWAIRLGHRGLPLAQRP